jgi:signal transduction histidine kinase
MKREETSWNMSFILHHLLPSAFGSVSSRHTLSRRNRERSFQNVARQVLNQIAMSYLESTDEKMASPPQSGGGENRQQNRQPDADRHISATLAHELNNLLTVVQGHADHLLAKHQDDAALAPNLKKISEVAHHAAELVRNAPRLDSSPPSS